MKAFFCFLPALAGSFVLSCCLCRASFHLANVAAAPGECVSQGAAWAAVVGFFGRRGCRVDAAALLVGQIAAREGARRLGGQSRGRRCGQDAGDDR